eukprot:768454-Hanusia_phi.AAC.1
MKRNSEKRQVPYSALSSSSSRCCVSSSLMPFLLLIFLEPLRLLVSDLFAAMRALALPQCPSSRHRPALPLLLSSLPVSPPSSLTLNSSRLFLPLHDPRSCSFTLAAGGCRLHDLQRSPPLPPHRPTRAQVGAGSEAGRSAGGSVDTSQDCRAGGDLQVNTASCTRWPRSFCLLLLLNPLPHLLTRVRGSRRRE